MFKNLLIAAAIVSFSPAFVFADNIFLAFNQGADATDASTVTTAAGSGSVYIYSDQPYAYDGADLDFTNSNPSVIQFTGGVAFNAVIPTPFGDFIKFDSAVLSFDPLAPTTDGRLLSVAILENGVNPAVTLVDPDYDAAVRVNGTPDGALTLARLDYDIVGTGTANIELSLGSNGVILLGADPDSSVLLNPSLGAATLTVTGIPEPSSVALLMLGSIGLVARRKRA